jgi:hypothetical protein
MAGFGVLGPGVGGAKAKPCPGFARQFNVGRASNRPAGESRHPDCVLVALRLDYGFRRNDELPGASELAGKAPCPATPHRTVEG